MAPKKSMEIKSAPEEGGGGGGGGRGNPAGGAPIVVGGGGEDGGGGGFASELNIRTWSFHFNSDSIVDSFGRGTTEDAHDGSVRLWS